MIPSGKKKQKASLKKKSPSSPSFSSAPTEKSPEIELHVPSSSARTSSAPQQETKQNKQLPKRKSQVKRGDGLGEGGAKKAEETKTDNTQATQPPTTLVQSESSQEGKKTTNRKKKIAQVKAEENKGIEKSSKNGLKQKKTKITAQQTAPTITTETSSSSFSSSSFPSTPSTPPNTPSSSSSSAAAAASSSSSLSSSFASSYSLGDLSALFSPNLEKDVFANALSVPSGSSSTTSSTTTAPVLGKHARKKLKKKGLPLLPPPPTEEKSLETKAEEGIVVNTEKIQQSLERQRQFVKGANHHEEDERLPRTIFVGNVPVKLPIKKLIKAFKVYGEVESARFRSFGQGDPKLSKRAAFATKSFHEDRESCNAYVVFKEEEAAKKALEHNGKTIEGNIVRVDMAGGSKKGDKNRSVFVGNLPLTVKENELRDFFSDSGPVENVRVVRDKMSGAGKGFAFVLFHDVASARKALAHDQSTFAERPLRVFKAVDKPKPLKKTAVKAKPAAGSAGKPRTFRKSTGGGAESWQGETARPSSTASTNKKRKHAIRGKEKNFVKKAATGEAKTSAKKPGNSAKKFRKENDRKHLKKPADS